MELLLTTPGDGSHTFSNPSCRLPRPCGSIWVYGHCTLTLLLATGMPRFLTLTGVLWPPAWIAPLHTLQRALVQGTVRTPFARLLPARMIRIATLPPGSSCQCCGWLVGCSSNPGTLQPCQSYTFGAWWCARLTYVLGQFRIRPPKHSAQLFLTSSASWRGLMALLSSQLLWLVVLRPPVSAKSEWTALLA